METVTYPIETMVDSFMIQFRFMGEMRFANVFTRTSDSAKIYVHLLDLRAHDQERIILTRTQDGFELSKDSSPVAEDLLCTIISAVNLHMKQ